MAEDRDDAPKPQTGAQTGTVIMQAVIRPANAEGYEAPISSTVAIPIVPEPKPPPAPTGPTQQSPLPMTECGQCHTMTPVAKFCSECGAPLVVRRFCSECGAKLDKVGAKFCDQCGAKVG